MLHKDSANSSTLSQPTWATRPRTSSLPELHEMRARQISLDLNPACHSLRAEINSSEEISSNPSSSQNSSTDYIPLGSIETHEAITAIERNRMYLNLNDQSSDSLIYNEEYIPLCSSRSIPTWKRVNGREACLISHDHSSRSSPAQLYGSSKTLSRREQILRLFPTIPPPPDLPLPSLPSNISLNGTEEIVCPHRTSSPLPQAPSPPHPGLPRKVSIGTFGEPKLSPAKALKQASKFLRPRTISGKLLKMLKCGRD
ncbi:hypothetical protein DFH28DRAFT_1032886 [Melampsora americana]|nr:hypothetical protein DFH28DRAFT_1032886 [Melampsora americana]